MVAFRPPDRRRKGETSGKYIENETKTELMNL